MHGDAEREIVIIKKKAGDELKRLEVLSPESPEYNVIRTYLDWLVNLPWQEETEDNLDIANARLTFASGCTPADEAVVPAARELASVAPNVYVNIRNDGIVEIYCHRSEMGQGIRTSLPQVIADELDADWDRIQLCAQAMALEEMLGVPVHEGAVFYGKPRRRERVTVGSVRTSSPPTMPRMRPSSGSRSISGAGLPISADGSLDGSPEVRPTANKAARPANTSNGRTTQIRLRGAEASWLMMRLPVMRHAGGGCHRVPASQGGG